MPHLGKSLPVQILLNLFIVVSLLFSQIPPAAYAASPSTVQAQGSAKGSRVSPSTPRQEAPQVTLTSSDISTDATSQVSPGSSLQPTQDPEPTSTKIIPTSSPSTPEGSSPTLESPVEPPVFPQVAGDPNQHWIYLPLVLKNYQPGLPANGPDLSLSVSDNNVTVDPGASVSYILTYKNTGPKDTSGVILTEYLPANSTFNAANSTAGWQQVGSTSQYTLTVGALISGVSGQATFAVIATNPVPKGVTVLQNNASIRDDGAHGDDPNTGNNSASDTTPINLPLNSIDLSVSLADGGTPAIPGGKIHYTIQYANHGATTASGVTLTETLPANTTYNASESTYAWQAGTNNTYTFNAGSLASGANGSVLFVVDVAPAAPAGVVSISNTVAIADDGAHGSDKDPTDNTSSVATTLNAQPDLVISVSDGGNGVLPGRTLTYTLSYSNAGNQGATGVVITETLPANTSYDANKSSSGWAKVGSTNQYTCSVGGLTAAASGQVKFVVTLASSIPNGVDHIANTAAIADDATNGADPSPANNSTNTNTSIVSAPDLILTQSDGGSSAAPESTITYTLSYSNQGNLAASGVVITEHLSAHTTFNDKKSATGWVQVGATDQYTYAIGSLAVGTSGSVTFAVDTATVFPAGVGFVQNTASIADDGTNGLDPVPDNNTTSAATPINAAPDLSLIASDDSPTTTPGSVVIYTLSYSNQGTRGASGVKLTETLPDNTSFNAAQSSSGWTKVGATNQYTYSVGTLEAGNRGSTTFAVTVTNSVPAGLNELDNTASISDDGANGVDPNSANNSILRSTLIDAVPDLSLTVSDGNFTATPNSVIAYTLTVSNTGNQGASGVKIIETVPANTTFLTAQSTGGWIQVGTTSQYAYTAGSLAAGTNRQVTFAVTLVDPVPNGVNSLSNTASVADDGTNGTDPTSANNSASDSTPVNASPDLSLTITDNATLTTYPGRTVVYTLAYANTGKRVANGVVITETLPVNTTFNAAQSASGWTQVGSTSQYTYSIASLALNTPAQVTFAVDVNDPIPQGTGSLTNQATIVDDGTNGADPTPANNSASKSTPISTAPELSLTMTPDSIVGIGGSAHFTLKYQNNGYQSATGLVITESLPGQSTFNNGESTSGWQLVSGNQYRYLLAQLDPGASGSVVFAATLSGSITAGTIVSDTASIADDGSHGPDPISNNNSTTGSSLVSTGPTNVCGTISANTSWTVGQSPYIVTCDTTINSGVTLTVGPGTIVRFNQNFGLTVNGTLNAVGTAGSIITFTGNTSSPVAGYWKGITVNSSSANTVMKYATIQFAGYGGSGGLRVVGAAIDFENNTISNSSNYGLYGTGIGSSTIKNNNFANNSSYAVSLSLTNGTIAMSGNTGSGNSRNGIVLSGSLGQNTSLPTNLGFPYIITGSLTVNSGVTLTLPAGNVLKFDGGSTGLLVNGTLQTQGTASSPVVFTSVKDDSVGGDSNGDGSATAPVRGDWDKITIASTGAANLTYTNLTYGGYPAVGTYDGTLYLTGNATANLDHVSVRQSGYYGIEAYADIAGTTTHLILTNSTVADNVSYGIYAHAITGAATQLSVTASTIQNNATYGIYISGNNTGSASVIFAQSV